MSAILRFFTSAYFVIFIVTLTLSLCFWFFSPWIGVVVITGFRFPVAKTVFF